MPTDDSGLVRSVVDQVVDLLRSGGSRVLSQYAALGYPRIAHARAHEWAWTVRLEQAGVGASLGLGVVALVLRHVLEGLLGWVDEAGRFPPFYATGEVDDGLIKRVGALEEKIPLASSKIRAGKAWLLVAHEQREEAAQLAQQHDIGERIVPVSSIEDLLERMMANIRARVAALEAQKVSKKVEAARYITWPGRDNAFFRELFKEGDYEHDSSGGKEFDELIEELFLLKHAATGRPGGRRWRTRWFAVAAGLAVVCAVGIGIWRSRANSIVEAVDAGRTPVIAPIGPAHVDAPTTVPAPQPTGAIPPLAPELPGASKTAGTRKRKPPAASSSIAPPVVAPDEVGVTSKCKNVNEACPQPSFECVKDFYHRACDGQMNSAQQAVCALFRAKEPGPADELWFRRRAKGAELCATDRDDQK